MGHKKFPTMKKSTKNIIVLPSNPELQEEIAEGSNIGELTGNWTLGELCMTMQILMMAFGEDHKVRIHAGYNNVELGHAKADAYQVEIK